MPVAPQVPVPAADLDDDRLHRRQIAEAVRQALNGKTNNTGTVTLTASSTTTTLSDSRITAASVILFMPTTASAASLEAKDLYVSARTRGSATLTHASLSAVDQTFAFAIIG